MPRFSKQREAVKTAVKSTTLHPSAEAVYLKVRQSLPNISMGTVYRNLKSLTDSGEIATVETTASELRFDGNTDEHAHFVCLNCGKIFDTGEEISGYKCLIDKGFDITHQKTVLYGSCPDCKN